MDKNKPVKLQFILDFWRTFNIKSSCKQELFDYESSKDYINEVILRITITFGTMFNQPLNLSKSYDI